MYAGVPTSAPAAVSASTARARSCERSGSSSGGPASFASPKSVTSVRWSREIRTFSGLTSRWISPAACAAASPRPTASATSSTARHGRGVAHHARNVMPSTSSIAQNARAPSVPKLVHRDDVGMIQPRHRLCLAPHPRRAHPQQLDRDLAIELGIARRPDLTHGAAAERPDQREPAELLTRGDPGIFCRLGLAGTRECRDRAPAGRAPVEMRPQPEVLRRDQLAGHVAGQLVGRRAAIGTGNHHRRVL